MIEGQPPLPDRAHTGEDMAGIFYTGGTTGFSKGVMLSHRSLWASAMSFFAINAPTPEPVMLHAAPMFHLADVALIMSGIITGGVQAVIPFFSAEGVLAAIERHRVTDMLLVPTMIWVRLRVQWLSRTLEFLCLLPLTIPAIAPTMSMEVTYALQARDGRPVTGTIHNTIHALGD